MVGLFFYKDRCNLGGGYNRLITVKRVDKFYWV